MRLDFDADTAGRLENRLMLGLARDPPPEQSLSPLAQLSLLAAWKRAGRPAPPRLLAAAPARTDARGLMPDASRMELLRLFADRNAGAGDAISQAVFRAMRRAGVRLHPFDYARLESAIAQNIAGLGEAERVWLMSVRPGRNLPEAAYDGPPVTEATLAAAGKPQKLAFLQTLRAADPPKALELIRQLFASEPATTRNDLLGVLSSKTGDHDREFLLSLASDRAQSVRERADQLLARLPGTDAHARRIERLRGDIQVKTEGLIRRRKVLRYTAPANVAPEQAGEAQRTLLAGLALQDVAAALGETEAALCEIAARSGTAGDLPFLLLVKAVEAGHHGLAAPLAAVLDGDGGGLMLELLETVLPTASAAARAPVIDLAFQPDSWPALPPPWVMARAAACLGEPLPRAIASALLNSQAWQKIEPERTADMAEAVAPLIPASLSERFAAGVAAVSPRAAQYHRFLLTLPNPNP